MVDTHPKNSAAAGTIIKDKVKAFHRVIGTKKPHNKTTQWGITAFFFELVSVLTVIVSMKRSTSGLGFNQIMIHEQTLPKIIIFSHGEDTCAVAMQHEQKRVSESIFQ